VHLYCSLWCLIAHGRNTVIINQLFCHWCKIIILASDCWAYILLLSYLIRTFCSGTRVPFCLTFALRFTPLLPSMRFGSKRSFYHAERFELWKAYVFFRFSSYIPPPPFFCSLSPTLLHSFSFDTFTVKINLFKPREPFVVSERAPAPVHLRFTAVVQRKNSGCKS